MIEVGKTYWIDFGNHIGEHKIIRRKLILKEHYLYVITLYGRDYDIHASEIFETQEECLEHLQEKADGYAYYASVVREQIRQRELDEDAQAEEEAADMTMQIQREDAR